MSDAMAFPETWEEFEESYGFADREKVYTNGTRLIPSFRVKQWLDYCKNKKTSFNWHTGTPTEDGDYVVICQYTMNNYMTRTKTIWAFQNGRWDNSLERFFSDFKVIAWYGQKIEPFVGSVQEEDT